MSKWTPRTAASYFALCIAGILTFLWIAPAEGSIDAANWATIDPPILLTSAVESNVTLKSTGKEFGSRAPSPASTINKGLGRIPVRGRLLNVPQFL